MSRAVAAVAAAAQAVTSCCVSALAEAVKVYAAHNNKFRRLMSPTLPDGTPNAAYLAPTAPVQHWVHQRYAPVAVQGQNRKPALSALYGKMVAAGRIAAESFPAVAELRLSNGTVIPGRAAEVRIPTFVEAVKFGLVSNVLVQAPTRNGFLLAVKADLPAREAGAPQSANVAEEVNDALSFDA